jgi:hypothetical protein
MARTAANLNAAAVAAAGQGFGFGFGGEAKENRESMVAGADALMISFSSGSTRTFRATELEVGVRDVSQLHVF